jgi:hypothetical protein
MSVDAENRKEKMETWRPATLDDVLSILRDDLRSLNQERLELFEKIRIQPIQLPVLCYPGEAVWAVAEHQGRYLYWSDIEEGWELDVLQPGGGIRDRGCSQFELHHIMYQLFHAVTGQ